MECRQGTRRNAPCVREKVYWTLSMTDEINYQWEEFEKDVRFIVEAIRRSSRFGERFFSGFSGIYAVPRGGLVLGVRLSHELDLPLIYGGVDRKVLVVDDIADSGNTLEPYRKRGCAIATIFKHQNCPFTPHFYARENSVYVNFPWERAK
jgi:hypoxanthine phosphoribosyltransferase